MGMVNGFFVADSGNAHLHCRPNLSHRTPHHGRKNSSDMINNSGVDAPSIHYNPALS